MVKLRDKLAILAAPGLRNPHYGHEARLMIAGAKPVAIMASEDVSSRMQQTIDSGHIVLIGEHSFERNFSIYCIEEALQDAQKAAVIVENERQRHKIATPEEYRMLHTFFLRPCDTPPERFKPSRHFSIAAEGIEKSLYHDTIPTEVEDLLAKRILALPPLRTADSRILEEAVSRGEIFSQKILTTTMIMVFAQADKIAEGKELFARYYNQAEGYEILSSDDATRRHGELLGYTKNDIEYFMKLENGSIPENTQDLYDRTRDKRQQARIELMLMNAPRREL